MDLKVAYNKVDNLCCYNHNVVNITNMDIDKGIVPNKIDFFEGYNETKDEDFCKDAYEMIDALETIKEVVDLQDKIGCPLTVFIKAHTQGVYCLDQKRGGLKWILRGFANSNNFDSNHLLGFFDDRLLYKEDDPKFNIYYWRDYKKTWWLKEDRSE